MRYALQGDDCWAGRDKLIKGNRQNTSVHNDTYKHLVPFSTSKTRDQLIVEFNETLKSLREAQQGNATISSSISTFNIHYDEEKIMRLLKMKIEKPELTEREHYLLELAQTGNTSQLNRMVTIFSNKNVCACPVCMQPVSEEYKQNLVQSVQKVLSKAVEEHQESLRQFIMDEIEFNFSPFIKLANTDLCSKLLLEFNAAIKYNNLVIQSKIDDPYTPCEQQLQPISTLLTRLNVAFDKLECERIEYNKEITATKPIVDYLTKINNQIAHFDIQDSYLRYLACAAQAKKEQEKLVELQNASARTKHRLDELEAMQKNVQVAVSIINNNLNYIFFSNTRFKIDYRNGNYILLSNGKSVRPSQVSQGERNIIGLCYFFASILQNQEESSGYTKEYLLVIDDPVSSFDIENKTGIMSFLRYQLGKFLLGNKDTRAIIMTHDLPTYYDSEKIFKELTAASETICGEKPVYRLYELKNQKLVTFSYNKRQEYSELIKIVYNYALGNATEYELVIGNIMRQMLEAFSTFQYKKGFDDISTDQSILALLPEDVYKTYFENLMYRLILNNGSHRLEQTQSMSDMYFFTVISDSEKQRTAKEILCFIYLLNKKHLLSHLEGCTDIESNLQHWCNDIKNSCLM
ncbi:MAG: AAA family ATPase [Lachnospiraceae bacterium]|nr:AAA family ATPase [Lachnospiraceae bacterium]